jgi:hypothetical protein
LIDNACQNALKKSNPEPDTGHFIRELLNLHLQRLTDLHANLTSDEVKALIDRYCDAVLIMATELKFELSELRELVPILRSAWKKTVVAALEDGRPRSVLKKKKQEFRQQRLS